MQPQQCSSSPFTIIFLFDSKVRVDSLESRLRLWQKYVELQVFNELSRTWVKLMLVPTIASVTTTIIVCFYVTIRHEDLPAILIANVAYVGVALLGILFWIFQQMIGVMRISEAVIAALTTITPNGSDNGRNPGWELKHYIVRRGKATRKLHFRVGEFTEASLDVSVGIWDEILNQLLFLLSFIV